jgi:hypothetical protein
MIDRARGRECKKCDFYDPIQHEKSKGRGFCRINPPTRQWLYRMLLGSDVLNVGWPLVHEGDWCGKFDQVLEVVEVVADEVKGDHDGSA